MLSFLSPLFLLGAVAAAIPIVLHLLKRNPEERVKFAAVKLLRRAPVEDVQRRHLRELLLLALRVAALLLLAVAFARPLAGPRAAARPTGVTVVALDTSLSLSAPGQFERARQLARDAVRRAPSGDLVGVVTFATAAHAVARPSEDRALAVAAIDAANAGFGATRYRAAFLAASELIRSAGAVRSTIVVVTDLQETGWDAGDRASVPESARLEVADVGAPPPNLSVVAARLSADRLVATIHSSGSQPREARVRLMDASPPGDGGGDGQSAVDAAVSVAPNQTADVTFPLPRGRSAVVSVDDRQGIQGDNRRYVVLESGARRPVLIVSATGNVSRDAFYLRQALAAGPPARADDAEGIAGAQLQSWDGLRMDAHAAVVVVSTRGFEHHGRELLADYVRKGGGLLVAAGADVDGQVIADALGDIKDLALTAPSTDRDGPATPRAFAPVDVRHPIFAAFGQGAATLSLVRFQRISIIRSSCHVLARFTTGEAALVECPLGTGRVLILASDLDNRGSDFPLHATFVPFVHEVLRYLSASRASAQDYVVGDTPPGVPDRPGIASIATEGSTNRLVAVNVDPRESDASRLSPEEFGSAVMRLKDAGEPAVRVEARQQEDRQQLWRYVLAIMMAALVVESLVARRTG